MANRAPIARKGANGIVRLRAENPCRATRMRPAAVAGGERDQHRLGHPGAEIEAEHRGELHVAQAHPVRADQRRREQDATRRQARQQPLGHTARLPDDANREGDRQVRHERDVRDQPSPEVADRDYAEQGDERSVEDRAGHIVESPVSLNLSP